MRNPAVPVLVFIRLWCVIFCNIQDPLTSEINIHSTDLPTRTLSPRSVPGYCPDEWRAFGDNCYKELGFLRSDAKSWYDAASHCQSIGANLTSIHSEEEQDFLNSFAFDVSTKIWIGLRRASCSSYRACHGVSFEWKDNSPTDYFNWAGWIPSSGEFCIYLIYYHGGSVKWHATGTCNEKYSYICKKRKDPTLKKPGKDPAVCAEPQGWLRVKNSCYKEFSGSENPSTWSEAESSCNSYAGNLASVRNIGVTLQFSQKLKGLIELFWIGVKSTENHEYTWLGREILIYTNWMSGQPTDMSDDLNCVAINPSGEWVVRNCSEKLPFICEIREGVPTIAPPHPNMTCPKTSSRWNDFGGKYCYIIEPRHQFTQMEASKLCCHEGGSLASIHSRDEINAILHYTAHHGHMYIGFERNQNGDFVWNDGSTVDFVNWDDGEPTGEMCTEMHTSGRWNDMFCTGKYGYVCSTLKVPKTEDPVTVVQKTEDPATVVQETEDPVTVVQEIEDPVTVGYVSQLSSCKIALIIIICLILGAVAAGLGYYYFYLSKRRKQTNEVLECNVLL